MSDVITAESSVEAVEAWAAGLKGLGDEPAAAIGEYIDKLADVQDMPGDGLDAANVMSIFVEDKRPLSKIFRDVDAAALP
jgi:hypothetical protein